jgi:hypothetical protein
MRRCAFLTMDSLEGFVSDDELVYPPLAARGWGVEAVPWRRPGVDWGRFEAVVIRTTWDYQNAPEAFLSILDQVQVSGTHLENALDLVRWNMNKRYLRDLERGGIALVPTVWGSDIGTMDESEILRRLGTDEVVLKPEVGANADHTYRLGRSSPGWRQAAVAFERRAYLAQPFIASIVTEGEYSLVYFGGEFSHAIVKTPRAHDFRVQEEHGGIIRPVDPSPELVEAGRRVLAALAHVPLYARADFVRLEGGVHALMELELIEPSLYFRMDQGAPERFARALDERFQSLPTGAGGVAP